MTRLCMSHVGKRAIHLSVDSRVEQISNTSVERSDSRTDRKNGLHKGP